MRIAESFTNHNRNIAILLFDTVPAQISSDIVEIKHDRVLNTVANPGEACWVQKHPLHPGPSNRI